MSIASATTGGVSGIIGQTNVSSGDGVHAIGRLGASGRKNYRIDHPDDPENKYLLHFASERPEVINFYSGKVVLDNEGEDLVELPAYFAKINNDPSYQLTALEKRGAVRELYFDVRHRN